jgi:hypothetical protein
MSFSIVLFADLSNVFLADLTDVFFTVWFCTEWLRVFQNVFLLDVEPIFLAEFYTFAHKCGLLSLI